MYVKNKKDNILVTSIIKGLEELKALNITLIDIKDMNSSITDYFVICHAKSSTHVSSITDRIIESVRKETKEKPFHKEGLRNAEWILLDYMNVIVHIFKEDRRDFYDIEGLWADGIVTQVTNEDMPILDIQNN